MLKIDLVYLWVDGADPVWRAKKNAALAAAGRRQMDALSVSDERWRDNDELKYSLRSVEKFAPWINHIFIVTDGQRPEWLADNPRVSIVDQNDIVPPEYAPLFNSAALELFIHKIHGLSEHFIYANDDNFIGRPLQPEFFFDSAGNPIVILGERWVAPRVFHGRTGGVRMFKEMQNNALYFVYKKFGKKYNVTMTHSIEPFRKSYLAENIENNIEEFIKTTATTFREKTNFQKIVFGLIDNAQGRNTIVWRWGFGSHRIPYYVRRDTWGRRICLWFFREVLKLTGMIRVYSFDSKDNIVAKMKRCRPDTFSINDLGARHDSFTDALDYMNRMFPNKSEFEK
ncbi:hypothetical protein FACS189421_06730 [Bacteroidia bacterium]|nr:hypothetical protein FACS189421_06730 [Bacteroidia bacterium]